MKKKIYSILCILIIAIMIFVICSMLNHATAKTGEDITTITKWNFCVNEATENFGTINLSETMKSNGNVAANRIAPGTEGCFNILLDGSKSNTALDYLIKMKIVSKPTNLHFYLDSECTKMLSEEDEIIEISGTIDVQNINKPVARTIYWKWPYETGNTEEEIIENDIIDTQDQGINTLFNIEVTGIQR